MSYDSLLNQTVQIKRKSGLDRHGRETVGSATSYSARFERTNKNVFKPDGSLLTIDGKVFLPNAAAVGIDDELIYETVSYRVVNVKDRQGYTDRHHITCEVVKWLK